MPEVTHESVFFTGHVQGVGFRFSTLQVAKEFEVTGFVKNLLDGRVQLEVEGNAEEIDSFLAVLEEKMHGYIRKMERSRRVGPAQYNGFTIQ
jgi:acylphosphatase